MAMRNYIFRQCRGVLVCFGQSEADSAKTIDLTSSIFPTNLSEHSNNEPGLTL